MPAPVKPKYPYVGRIQTSTEDFDVLFFQEKTGIIVEMRKSGYHQINDFKDHWMEAEFTEIKDSVTVTFVLNDE